MKKDVIIYTVGVLLSRGIALIIIPIYIGYITTQEFGRIDLINQITNFIILITCLEISQGLSRYFYDSNDQERTIYINSAFWFSLSIQCISLTVILSNSHFLAQWIFGSESYSFEIQLMGFIAFFATFNSFFTSLFIISKQAKNQGINSILYTGVSGLTTLFFVVNFQYGVLGVLYGLLSAYFVSSLYGYYKFRESISFKWSKKHTFQMLFFSLPLVFSSSSIYILNYFDRFMISSMLDTSSLGIYSLGFMLSLIGGISFSVFKLIITPFVLENYKFDNFHFRLENIVKVFLIVVIITLVFSDLFSHELVDLFADERFNSAAPLIKYFVASSAAFTTLNFFPGMILAKKTIPLALIIISSALLNIGLNFVMIPHLGFYGAAIATCAANIFMAITNCFFSKRFFSQKTGYLAFPFLYILAYLYSAEYFFQFIPEFNEISTRIFLFILVISFSILIIDPKFQLIKFILKTKYVQNLLNN